LNSPNYLELVKTNIEHMKIGRTRVKTAATEFRM